MELVEVKLAHKKNQRQVNRLSCPWKTLKAELVLAKEQVELARNDVLIVSATRSSAKGSIDELTAKVVTFEESLSQL